MYGWMIVVSICDFDFYLRIIVDYIIGIIRLLTLLSSFIFHNNIILNY